MNVVDRSGDYSGGRWRGKVVNVMDPKKSGRIQVRVFGIHDNEALIPDSDLPWALVSMPINSGASARGVAGSPVGVIPGSVVDGYFGDSDRRILIATGTFMSAGRTKPGEIVDGSYSLDTSYNDVAHSARGQDLNAAFGLKNLPAVSQIGAIFPSVSAGVGSLASHTGNILSLMSQVDPSNMSGSMATAVTGFAKSYALNELSSIASSYIGGLSGVVSLLGQAQSLISQGVSIDQAYALLPTELKSLVGSYPGGIINVLSIANSVAAINPASLIGGNVGSLMNTALGLSSVLGGGVSSVINQALGTLSVTKKLRQFALEAAAPTPPPLPDPPTSTSSKAAITPSTSSSGTDPWAQAETYELPKTITSLTDLNKTLESAVASASSMQDTVTNAVDSVAESQNIMNQILNQTTTIQFTTRA